MLRTGSAPRSRLGRWQGKPIDWSAYAFLLPFLIPFVLFSVGAILFGAFVAFTNWSIVGQTQWVGIENFRAALADPAVQLAFLNTFRYGLIVVPAVTILGFVGALFVNQRWPGSIFARAAFYASNTVSSTVVGLIWVWMLDTRVGFVNQFFGVRIPWLTSTDLSVVGVSIATIWWDVGLAFVLFLAALQEIDPEVKDAAAVDGAGRWASTRYIVLPLIRSTLSLVVTLEVISTLRIFSQINVLTAGGPAGSSSSVIQYIYNFGIIRGKFGYASAVALMLFGCIIVVTVIYRRVFRGRA
jgi:multiple sugar transport system permease protein